MAARDRRLRRARACRCAARRANRRLVSGPVVRARARLVGALDLALDLVLADDHRLEARRSRGTGAAPRRSCAACRSPRASSVGRDPGVRARAARSTRALAPRPASLEHDVDLGAVAGRDRDRLADRRLAHSAVTKRAASRSVSATRSRSATGAMRWEIPSEQQLGHGAAFCARSSRRHAGARRSSVSSPSSRSIRPSLPAMIAT